MRRRTAAALVLLAALGCGRRGPPQPPLVIIPEAPKTEPMLQEGGELLIRWTAPTTDDRGRLQQLRLRRAVLEMRVLDVLQLAADAAAERVQREPAAEQPVPEPETTTEQPAPEPEPEPEPVPEPETATEQPAPEPEPEPEPEAPRPVRVGFEAVEYQPFERIDSETPGETHTLRVPVDEEWVGRRLEVRISYEAASGPSQPAEPLSLDVTGPLPPTEGLEVEVGDGEVALRWSEAAPTGPLADAALLGVSAYEVFRRRASGQERAGRTLLPEYTDDDVRWGEPTCYSVRLVMEAAAESRVIPVAPTAPVAETDDGDPAPVEPPAEPPVEAPVEPPVEAPVEPPVEAPAEAPAEVPVEVPPASPGGMSVGPRSEAVCVTPVDTFAPATPADLRAIQTEAHTDLSWLPVTAPDLAGYHVYRAGESGDFDRLTDAPVPEPDWRDADRDPEAEYRYRVTAVDTASPPNESAPGAPITVRPR